MLKRAPTAPTLHVVSLGCAKAQVDAEAAVGHLLAQGYRLVESPEGADLVVVNTCGFIRPAVEESVEAIVALGEAKAAGRIGQLLVAGCLVDRYGNELADELPEVDRFVGSSAFREWAATAAGRRTLVQGAGPALPTAADPRARLNAGHYAYVKIAEGCDRACAFCTIPAIRGAQRSRPAADVLAELATLATGGVVEAALVSQDTVRWGLDLQPRARLSDLLAAIEDAAAAPPWVRAHYLYPERFSPELVRALTRGRRVVPYVDVPIQHGDDGVLAAMRRAHRRADIERLLEALRTENPDVAIRTTVIVGHPGETPAAFDALCELVAAAHFDAVGIFTYWDEEGTPAHARGDKVDEHTARERATVLDEIARAAAAAANERWVGRELDVLVDGRDPGDGRTWVGRHPGQAADVDGVVRLNGWQGPAGQLVRVTVAAADGHDLLATPLNVAAPLRIL